MLKKEVVIVQRRLTHYREVLFDKLKKSLQEKNVSLRLLVGTPNDSEIKKKDSGYLDWAESIPTHYFGELCWQPFRKYTSHSDMVIITQENKLLYNLLALSIFRPPIVAFWGHGCNFQSRRPSGLKERFKHWTTNKPDWWFAYTELTAELVKKNGFPAEKITNLENAVDTNELSSNLINLPRKNTLRQQVGLPSYSRVVGIFVGSLYQEKRIDFLLEAADNLHAIDAEFFFIIIGDGPLRNLVEKFCAKRSWCLWLGAKSGYEKAIYLNMADVYLNPGLVGLGVLDSFVAEVPMITTCCGLHSPEISYLKHGENGHIAENSISAFVTDVKKVLYNNEYKNKLIVGCRKSAQHYTIDNMVDNFCEGILCALSSR